MAALQIGPLALPTSPLLWLGALLLSSALASRLAGPQARAAADAVWLAALAGFGVARAAFVIGASDASSVSPAEAGDCRRNRQRCSFGVCGVTPEVSASEKRQEPYANKR